MEIESDFEVPESNTETLMLTYLWPIVPHKLNDNRANSINNDTTTSIALLPWLKNIEDILPTEELFEEHDVTLLIEEVEVRDDPEPQAMISYSWPIVPYQYSSQQLFKETKTAVASGQSIVISLSLIHI